MMNQLKLFASGLRQAFINQLPRDVRPVGTNGVLTAERDMKMANLEAEPKDVGGVSCTHPVPANPYGIFALHAHDNETLPDEAMRMLLAPDGPVAAVQDVLAADRAQVLRLGEHH